MPNGDPTSAAQSPKWPRPATKRIAELVKTFEENLRVVSTQLARHEEADNVDRRHVNTAFDALARVGLHRRFWWQRPELEVGIGSFLVGIAFASPDLLALLGIPSALILPIVIVFLAGGAFCAIHGWFRGKL